MEYKLTIGDVVHCTAIYFLMCGLIPTVIDIAIWRSFDENISAWLNISTQIIFNIIFIMHLIRKFLFKINIFENISIRSVILAIACAVLFFILLDKYLDPIFDSMFIVSAENYQKTLTDLKQTPAVNFIRICLLAPIIEEILIRGYILKGLQNKYGIMTALVVSSVLFALLHFNFVQTLSALVCGIILGLLYVNTDCLFCCILAHFLYNSISYFTIILTKFSAYYVSSLR